MVSLKLLLPLAAILSTSCIVSGYVQRGFLLTAPKTLGAGTEEQLCITFFNIQSFASIKILLLPKQDSSDSESLASLTKSIRIGVSTAKQTSCFDFSVPKTLTDTRIFIRAIVKSSIPSFFGTKTSPIGLRPYELVTLVQTDKTKYKAGQLVQFRVVTLRSDLTALEQTIDQIYITTPGNTRLAQFDDVKTESGIAQESFQLTDEPPLGKWTIHVKRGDQTVRQTFVVEEFVLPRFGVTLKAPDFIVRSANTITIKICAEYTFGKPVTGAEVSLYVASSVSYYRIFNELQSRSSSIRKDARQNITITEETGKDGCATVDVLLSKIGLGSGSNLYAYRLLVKANVTEAGTGLAQSADATVPVRSYSQRNTIKTDQFSSTFIKPGLDYVGYATITNQDGKPLQGERLEVCHTITYDTSEVPELVQAGSLTRPQSRTLPITIDVPRPGSKSSRTCRTYESDKEGRITYTILAIEPGLRSVSIQITNKSGSNTGSAYLSLRVWYSPTGSYIAIVPAQDPSGLTCKDSLRLRLVSTNVEGPAVYQVMARGQIVQYGDVVFSNKKATLTIDLSFDLTPQFKVLIFHVNYLGEVVSDSRIFVVKNCFQSPVGVRWNKNSARPGERVTLTVTGARGSLCGITAVDKSVELLSDANKLTKESVFSKLERFIIQQYAYPRLIESANVYCKRKPVGRSTPIRLDASLRGVRSLASQASQQAARFVAAPREDFVRLQNIEELPVREIRPLPRPIPVPIAPQPKKTSYDYFEVREDDSIKAFDVAGFLPVTNLALEVRRCLGRRRSQPRPQVKNRRQLFFAGGGVARRGSAAPPGVNFALAAAAAPVARAKSVSSDNEVAGVAVERRESTAARLPTESAPATETAQLRVRSLFPDTFLFQLTKLKSTRGQITKILPDTITSWIGSAFCSHPTSGFGLSGSASITAFKPFFAQIQLPFSVKRGELLPLKVSVFNFKSEDLSVSVVLQRSADFSLDGGPEKQLVCVRQSTPTVVTFPLTFNSLGDVDITVEVIAGGSACRTTTTERARDALRRSVLVKPEGFPQEETFSAYVCRTKDTVGNTVVQEFEIERKSTLVKGSERIWVSTVGDLLAPSVANLERLVRVPTGCGEQNMLGFVPNIIVREYLEAVGLITTALRTRTTNNMRTGYQRQLTYRGSDGSYAAFQPTNPGSAWLSAYVTRSYVQASKYIAIDSADLDITRRWLLNLQESDGSFPKVGRLFHREMQGGVQFGGKDALTAYVILALVESGSQQTAINKALAFLRKTTTYETVYTEVLVAHAFVIAKPSGSEGRSRIQKLLAKAKRRGTELYWEGDRGGRLGGSKTTDVEMTAYMVLSLLKLGGQTYLGEAALAVKWINSQRNPNGGFVSTQDTVVALTALAQFAIATYSESVAVTVAVRASRGGFSQQWTIDADTRLLTQQAKVLPLSVPNSLIFRIGGLGCALVQTVYRYSTIDAFPKSNFDLSARIIKPGCSSFTLNVCGRFSNGEVETNMVIIEVEMLSGWVTVDSSLRKLKEDGVIKRWEFNEGKAVLYFDEFTTREKCFSVRLLQDVEVQGLKPAVVRIYDYYATEDRFEVEYGPPKC